MRTSVSLYHRHRFPAEIIGHCVWLYFQFALSFRDVEEMLAMRGVALTYETVREWCLKFGQTYVKSLRRKSARPGDQWHLDEVFLKMSGRIHYLWRAVYQDGDVLDILVQSRRDQKAASPPRQFSGIHCCRFSHGGNLFFITFSFQRQLRL